MQAASLCHREVAPAVDLILATVGRTEELGRFLRSLLAAGRSLVRLILVDQNADDRLVPIVDAFASCIPIVHLRAEPGLSRARNLGLRAVEADLVGFPDDDCWYLDGFLDRLLGLMRGHPEWDGISGRTVDATGTPSSARWANRSGPIGRTGVWTRGVSTTIFLRRSVLEAVGAYDETLGAGSGTRFGSGEETDYLLRALDAGFSLHFEPTLEVGHADNRLEFDRAAIVAGRRYGAGMGRVLRRHHPWWFAAYHCIRAFGGGGMALASGRPAEARFLASVGIGRVDGWLRR